MTNLLKESTTAIATVLTIVVLVGGIVVAFMNIHLQLAANTNAIIRVHNNIQHLRHQLGETQGIQVDSAGRKATFDMGDIFEPYPQGRPSNTNQ